LQDGGELPADMVLIKPKPEFCVQASSSKKKKMKFDHDVFINLCSCKEFKPPTSQNTKVNGKDGQTWALPYSAGKLRYD